MDDSKNKKSIGMLIMILALVLVAVILIVVIVASSGSSETTTADPAATSDPTSTTGDATGTGDPTGTGTPTGTDAPVTQAPPVSVKPADPVSPSTDKAGENGKITVDVKDTYTGLLLTVDGTHKYSETHNVIFKNDATATGFTRINSKLPSVDNTHYLRTEALDALVAMIQTFDSVAGTNKPFQVRGYTTGMAGALDSSYVTGNMFKMYQLSSSGTLGLNYYNNKVSLDGQMVTYEKWFAANAAKFGFVYLGLTGNENHAAGEFRYVGTVHAEGIKQTGSLANYVASVKGGTLTSVVVDGTTWNLTYKEVTAATEIEVGKNATYTVSGDNLGGVIVAYTVAK